MLGRLGQTTVTAGWDTNIFLNLFVCCLGSKSSTFLKLRSLRIFYHLASLLRLLFSTVLNDLPWPHVLLKKLTLLIKGRNRRLPVGAMTETLLLLSDPVLLLWQLRNSDYSSNYSSKWNQPMLLRSYERKKTTVCLHTTNLNLPW